METAEDRLDQYSVPHEVVCAEVENRPGNEHVGKRLVLVACAIFMSHTKVLT
jgi:hypothetical protein